MVRQSLSIGMLTTVAMGVLSSPAFALNAHMSVIGETSIPIGHYEFCKRYPAECGPTRVTPPLHLTEKNWNVILSVNYDVNHSIQPMSDQEHYGVPEFWAYPKRYGDCEDYVLLKRRRLIKAGIPASDLLITVVLRPNGDGHAVLTLRTDRGDQILDNMRDKVLLWSKTEYKFIKRQSVANAGKWMSISDTKQAIQVGSFKH